MGGASNYARSLKGQLVLDNNVQLFVYSSKFKESPATKGGKRKRVLAGVVDLSILGGLLGTLLLCGSRRIEFSRELAIIVALVAIVVAHSISIVLFAEIEDMQPVLRHVRALLSFPLRYCSRLRQSAAPEQRVHCGWTFARRARGCLLW